VVDVDREFMRVALLHAARGRGRTSPNPMVGCVIVTPDGVVVGTGYHERAGGPHAEVEALRAAGAAARGGTLYCTLEPCAHHGRTGPCVVPIVEAGVRRVVAAVEDPNPLVAGRGFAYLRDHGIDVDVGVRSDEALALNAAFFTSVRLGRPHVTLKIATSLDGKVAEAPGRRTPLTSPEANRWAQRVRAEVDAIVVGSETILVDDPWLTPRGALRERPLLRLVLDGRLRTPPSARVLSTIAVGPVVLASSSESLERHGDRAELLRAAGAEVVALPVRDIRAALAMLDQRMVRSVLLEGGPTVQRSAWVAGVVDRVQVYVTPHVLGPAGVAWEMPASLSLAALDRMRVEPLGPDVLVEGDVYRTH
jgi:diaminohydroxyphosphoribosylaminopyrimidine deaminase/5-amino-6-(5-phosphoribosylamino)uracil reductase